MNDRRHRWICRHRARPATPLPPRFQSPSRLLRLFHHRSSRGNLSLSRPPTRRGQAGWQKTPWPNEPNGKTRKPCRMLTEQLPRRPRPQGIAAVRRWSSPNLWSLPDCGTRGCSPLAFVAGKNIGRAGPALLRMTDPERPFPRSARSPAWSAAQCGTIVPQSNGHPDCALLHPGYETQRPSVGHF